MNRSPLLLRCAVRRCIPTAFDRLVPADATATVRVYNSRSNTCVRRAICCCRASSLARSRSLTPSPDRCRTRTPKINSSNNRRIQVIATLCQETVSASDEAMGSTGTLGHETSAKVVKTSRLRTTLDLLLPTASFQRTSRASRLRPLTRNRAYDEPRRRQHVKCTSSLNNPRFSSRCRNVSTAGQKTVSAVGSSTGSMGLADNGFLLVSADDRDRGALRRPPGCHRLA